jgi:hypothetical protein
MESGAFTGQDEKMILKSLVGSTIVRRHASLEATRRLSVDDNVVREPTDDGAADGSDAEYRREGFRNDRIWKTQENAESESEQPACESQMYQWDDQANGESIQERAKESCAFVWELQRQHHADRDRTEGDAG